MNLKTPTPHQQKKSHSRNDSLTFEDWAESSLGTRTGGRRPLSDNASLVSFSPSASSMTGASDVGDGLDLDEFEKPNVDFQTLLRQKMQDRQAPGIEEASDLQVFSESNQENVIDEIEDDDREFFNDTGFDMDRIFQSNHPTINANIIRRRALDPASSPIRRVGMTHISGMPSKIPRYTASSANLFDAAASASVNQLNSKQHDISPRKTPKTPHEPFRSPLSFLYQDPTSSVLPSMKSPPLGGGSSNYLSKKASMMDVGSRPDSPRRLEVQARKLSAKSSMPVLKTSNPRLNLDFPPALSNRVQQFSNIPKSASHQVSLDSFNLPPDLNNLFLPGGGPSSQSHHIKVKSSMQTMRPLPGKGGVKSGQFPELRHETSRVRLMTAPRTKIESTGNELDELDDLLVDIRT